MKKVFAFLLALTMLCSIALADTVSFNGTVTCKDETPVYAPIGGTVQTVEVTAGQEVSEDTVLATLKTEKVYATEDGTVTGIFGQLGDSAETVASRYGAVMYIEQNSKYTISASTDYAYSSTEAHYVRVGEQVYLKSKDTTSRYGKGLITAVNGSSFTVEVTEGDFLLSENVEVYRNEKYTAAYRIGRGTTSRMNPISVTASGSIVSIAVKDGDTVKKGDLLLETLTGTFDGYYMTGAVIYAGVSGVLNSIDLKQGSSVQKSASVATVYPTGSMRIEGSIDEEDLGLVKEGQKVSIELDWNADNEVTYEGTITAISHVANQGDNATYTVYVDFTPDADTRFGMGAVVTTIDEEIVTTKDGEVE